MDKLVERLPLLVAFACVWSTAHIYRHGVPKLHNVLEIILQVTVGLIPFLAGHFWLERVTKTVPEPYLVSIFGAWILFVLETDNL